MENKKINDPGLGTRYDEKSFRLVNRDGGFNIKRIGSVSGIRDVYQFLVSINWYAFNAIVFAYFIVLNSLFAVLYLSAGIENIKGIIPGSVFNNFLNAFYFSVQTFTSVGYGNFAPEGHVVHIISSFEAIFGLLSFALATGLLFARFSRPKAKIRFSKNLIIGKVNGKDAMLFRVINMRKSVLMEMHCRLLCTIMDEMHPAKRDYYRLNLEIDHIYFFPLSWTIVHFLDEESPFHKKSPEEIRHMHPELIVMIKGFDETFNQDIQSRNSYVFSEFKFGYKFMPCFYTTEDGSLVLDIAKIDEMEKIS